MAQEARIPLVTPNSASVIVDKHRAYVPGDVLHFQLRFDPAPDGYGKGEVRVVFERVDSAPPTELPGGEMTDRVPITIPLQDGVRIYSQSLSISEQLIPANGSWCKYP
jgi:hypothetical protein